MCAATENLAWVIFFSRTLPEQGMPEQKLEVWRVNYAAIRQVWAAERGTV